MCRVIYCGLSREIETVKDFFEEFKFYPILAKGYTEFKEDDCLCQADIENTFIEHKISFIYDGSNWVVI